MALDAMWTCNQYLEAGMDELNGKVALVTGASRGIGAAAARELARHGVKVVLAARSMDQTQAVADEIKSDGGQALPADCDVSSWAAVSGAVDLAKDTFGPVDILVNNAGLIEPISRLETSDPEAWAHVIDVNVNGVYYGIRAVLPDMIARGAGTIINISSGAATGVLEGWSHSVPPRPGSYH